MIKKIFLLITCALFLFFISKADDGTNADLLRSNGRIYVVVTVILVILLGLFLYLMRLDKKISKLEKEQKQ
jgi:heme export protein D (CcmD)